MAVLQLTCLVLVSFTIVFGAEIFIDTTSGRLKGLQEQVEGFTVNAFLGVPYAEPPVGNHRFRRPEKIKPRSGVIDATQKPSSCYQQRWNLQPDWIEPRQDFSEDCLYLNVWTPACHQASCEKKAIMIFFHGGAFVAGSSNVPAYHGAGLAAFGDVIVVVINYRLSVLGFFDANHPEGPENNGLHDQLEAVKWVKENAGNLGGDPDLITLFGESAGSYSIAFHLISPVGRTVFRRAIMESGCVYNPLGLDNPQRAVLKGDDLAKLVGCSREGLSLMTHPEKVTECLRGKPAQELIDAERELGHPMVFRPVYNSEFLPTFHHQAIQRGDMKSTEILLGLSKQEGASLLHILNPDIFEAKISEHLTQNDLMSFVSKMKKAWKFEMKQKDFDWYFESVQKDDAKQTLLALTNMAGDVMMNCPCTYFSNYFADKGNKLYRYLFTLHGNRSHLIEWSGTTHLDEMPYVFGFTHVQRDGFTEEDRIFATEIINVWSTFAKTGSPPLVKGKEWPPYTRHNPVYFDLNPEDYGVKSGWRKEQCDRIKYIFE